MNGIPTTNNQTIELKTSVRKGDFVLQVDIHLPLCGTTGIVGVSGSGKTTLLRVIAGLEPDNIGRVVVGGKVWQDATQHLPPHKRCVGYVSQTPNLFVHLTVAENINYAIKRRQRTHPEAQTNVLTDMYAALNINYLFERMPHQLSGGEAQRVALARALAYTPDILLLDEPLASLDDAHKQEIVPYMRMICEQKMLPTLYVSHSHEEIISLARCLIVLQKGQVTQFGTPCQLLASKRKQRKNTPSIQHKERSMRSIGLLGGMSWESTAVYYRLINQQVRHLCGELHSAPIVLRSVDFAEIARLQREGDWQQMADILAHEAQLIEQAGADCLLLCTNTMHKLAPEITSAISIPFLHIADVAAAALRQDGVTTVGLLGTQFTMQQDFYAATLRTHGIATIVPSADEQAAIHEIIFAELCQGISKPSSKDVYLRSIDALQAQGAQAIILGCTEIGLLISQQDTAVPLYDTTEIHAKKAVDYAMRVGDS